MLPVGSMWYRRVLFVAVILGPVGLIAVALPLTLGSGQSQLGTVVDGATGASLGLLTAVLIG